MRTKSTAQDGGMAQGASGISYTPNQKSQSGLGTSSQVNQYGPSRGLGESGGMGSTFIPGGYTKTLG